MKSPTKLVLAALAVTSVMATSLGVVSASTRDTVTVQLLNVSDFHGQLDPLVVGTSAIGGAPALSAYFASDRLANPNTITLTGGDAVGASPPLSSFFQDTPTIQAMNLMGFDVDTLGNHNFDAGLGRLQSQINLAQFSYVSANLTNRDANLTGVSDYKIFDRGGVKVAVIGVTNPEAPELVFPGNFGSIVISDPVKAALDARGAAKEAGAQIVVVIAHMGVTGFDAGGAPFGPLVDFAKAVNKDGKKNQKIDVIIGDHTDVRYSGMINGALVYENSSKGLSYAKAQLTVDARNHKLLDQSVSFVTPVVAAVTPDPQIEALLAPYRAQLAPLLGVQVGSSNRQVPRSDSCGQSAGRTCESLIGNVTADAMRTRYGVDFAITNSGGLRAALTCPSTDTPTDFCPAFTPPPFPITRGQVLTVLPFGNIVVTLSLNGAELKAMLENGVSAMPGVNGRFPQVSGLCMSYDIFKVSGSRVTSVVRQAADGSCTGSPVDLTTASTYTLAENDFMVNGGDGYANLAPRAVSREIMDQVLAEYVGTGSPLNPSIQGRIVCTTTGATACPTVTAP